MLVYEKDGVRWERQSLWHAVNGTAIDRDVWTATLKAAGYVEPPNRNVEAAALMVRENGEVWYPADSAEARVYPCATEVPHEAVHHVRRVAAAWFRHVETETRRKVEAELASRV